MAGIDILVDRIPDDRYEAPMKHSYAQPVKTAIKTAISYCDLTVLVLISFLCLGLSDQSAYADDNPMNGPSKSWTFSTYFENDLFVGTDQSYTNGVKLSWISPDLTKYTQSGALPKWSLPIVDLIPFIHKPGLMRNVAVSIGQMMYTPGDISRFDLIEDDRPYAGWLYLGVAFHSKSVLRLDSMEVQMGFVGPLSYAEEAQKIVHSLRDLQTPNGWNNQFENEPGLALIYEWKYRLFRWGSIEGFGMDTIVHAGGALGNVYTYGNAGTEIRIGWNIPQDFGACLIRPGGDTNAPSGKGDSRVSKSRPFGIHLFGAVDGRAILRDIFLDGNTFTASHSVDKRHFVSDMVAGVSLNIYWFKLTFAQALRTKEFDGQAENQHSFGSMTVSFTY